jgi:hypothetical protein
MPGYTFLASRYSAELDYVKLFVLRLSGTKLPDARIAALPQQ